MERIGILVSSSKLKRIMKNKPTYEKAKFYEEACQKYNLQPCFFTQKDLSVEDGTVLASYKGDQEWEREEILIPRVIHNRLRIGRKKRIFSLIPKGITVYNQQTLYGKLYIAKLLEKNKDFHSFLPSTLPLTKSAIQPFMESFDSFLLKPNKQSLGNGIIMVRNLRDTLWEICYRQNGKIVKEAVESVNIPATIMELVKGKKYLIQERIDLAEYHGSPFDMRVSVQKGESGKWQVTGIVARVAKVGNFVTNAAKGGKCYKLEKVFEDLPQLSLSIVKSMVEQVALSIVQFLDHRLPNLADAGLDIGIDQRGYPYFIEINLRDHRYTFGKANMADVWKKTFENPIAYARFLMDKNQL